MRSPKDSAVRHGLPVGSARRIMTRSLGGLLLVALSAGAVAATAGQPTVGARRAANEIRKTIADVREAISEVTPERSNIDEICFRVGSLYLASGHELEEIAATHADGSPRADQLITELLKDSRSLPSFCGDLEKTKNDRGYEHVKKGDVADLNRELANMDRRARELAGL
jgi:hypothetical protein